MSADMGNPNAENIAGAPRPPGEVGSARGTQRCTAPSAELVDKIAQAVLYEGYILYPYRPAVKNHQRWTFGGIFPCAYCESHPGGDAASMQLQCLVEGKSDAKLRIKLRFLHLADRLIEKLPGHERVGSLRAGERDYQSWQEATEREVLVEMIGISSLLDGAQQQAFAFAAERTIEPIADAGQTIGQIVRERQALRGTLHLEARQVGEGLVELTARVSNETPTDPQLSRDQAQMRSLASTHLILSATGGAFVSLTDPPERFREIASRCKNIGCWPALVGEPGQANTMLASPIILPDYPQIAPESPGDLFDGCEIDEILTLRIMTLTDEEKQQAASVDERVRQLLQRTETLARDQLMNLHGTMRNVHPAPDPSSADTAAPETSDPAWHVPWDPLAERKSLEKTVSAAVELKPGDRVLLRPRGRADIMDIALAGKAATIAAVEQDYENRVHLAVTIDDDPGSDLGADGKPGHRFYFGPDEVEVLEKRV